MLSQYYRFVTGFQNINNICIIFMELKFCSKDWIITFNCNGKHRKLSLKKKIFICFCSGLFLCFTGLPLAKLLLYWAGLPPVVLGPSVLSKGVETSPTGTQISPTCAQTMPRLQRACLRQAELF